MKIPAHHQLTRRAFLKATVLAAGLGSVYLAGCTNSPANSVGNRAAAPTQKPASVLSRGLPASVIPMGLGVNSTSP